LSSSLIVIVAGAPGGRAGRRVRQRHDEGLVRFVHGVGRMTTSKVLAAVSPLFQVAVASVTSL